MGSLFDAQLDVSKLGKVLSKMGAQARDMTPTMAIISEQLLTAVDDNFETAGHGKWQGLAESTKRRRRKGGGTGDHQILVDTGALAGSQHAEFGADFAAVGTDKFYAVFHVSDGARSLIPLRNFYDLPEEVYTTAIATILGAIAE